MKLNPYPFQEDAIKFHLNVPYSICALGMGLGKTPVALAVKEKLGCDMLVICPAYLKPNWLAEAKKFLGTDEGITVLSYDKFRSKVEVLPKYDFVVFDEAHYLKNPKAQRTRCAHGYIKDCLPKNLLLLTGTPVKNGVPEIWSLLKLCSYGPTRNDLFLPYKNSAYMFAERYCKRQYTFGNHFKHVGIRNAEELRGLLRPWYYRKRASQVLDLPPQVRKKINIAPDKHDSELELAWEAYNGGKVSEHFMTGKAVNALAKVQTSVEIASNIIQEGGNVVVFSDHVKSCEAIYDSLSAEFSGGLITGSTTILRRSDAINKFTNGQYRFIAATIGAMSVGVNLQAAQFMVINDYPWVPADLAQAEKRIHRIGQTGTCFYYYIFASEVDEMIYDKITDKLNVTREVTDG